VFTPVLEPVLEPVRERQKKEKAAPKPKVVQRAASPPPPAPFEPTFEELLGHMGRAMAQQRAIRTQSRLDLYSQFLS
jgi:hypothetical protein